MPEMKQIKSLKEEDILSLFRALLIYSEAISEKSKVEHRSCFSLILGIMPDLFEVWESMHDFSEVREYLSDLLEQMREERIRLQ